MNTDEAALRIFEILNRKGTPKPASRKELIGVRLAEERLRTQTKRCRSCGKDKPLTELEGNKTWSKHY